MEKHTHEYSKPRSKPTGVEVCRCGRFRFLPEYAAQQGGRVVTDWWEERWVCPFCDKEMSNSTHPQYCEMNPQRFGHPGIVEKVVKMEGAELMPLFRRLRKARKYLPEWVYLKLLDLWCWRFERVNNKEG